MCIRDSNVLEYRSQIASMQAQQVELQLPNQGPEAAARVELDAVRKQLGDIAGRLEVMENSLAPPQRMSGLLEDMIGRQPGLHLVSLKTLPVVPVSYTHLDVYKRQIVLDAVDIPELAQRNVAALLEDQNRGLAFLRIDETGMMLTLNLSLIHI